MAVESDMAYFCSHELSRTVTFDRPPPFSILKISPWREAQLPIDTEHLG